MRLSRALTGLLVPCLAAGLTTGTSATSAVPAHAADAVAGAGTIVPVAASDETTPVSHGGDAADDPAIWVHPGDPARSLLLGNDKRGALEVYDLSGALRQRISTGTRWGNVDVRQGVSMGSHTRDVVAAYNNGLRLFTVDVATRRLVRITDGAGVVPTGDGEGLCLYDSRATGRLSAFVVSRAGRVRQYMIDDDDRDGRLYAHRVREFRVASEAEGCVADDATGALYVAQEDVGLWRYGAEPRAGSARRLIDRVRPNGHLAADVEGVTLVDLPGTGGYILASAQNVSDPQHSYVVAYDRRTNAYRGSFRVVGSASTDGCQRTDGIAAWAGNLGPAFPSGLFVCQDNHNAEPGTDRNQNFKLVRLGRVLAALH